MMDAIPDFLEHRSHPEIAQVLDSAGFGTRVKSFEMVDRRIKSASFPELLDLVANLLKATAHEKQRSHTPFTFIGTRQFAGGPFPCASSECRLAPADDLGKFSALYADHVYLPNPVKTILLGEDPRENEWRFRHEISICLKLFMKLRPLIEAELVSFVEPGFGSVCHSCFVKAWNEISEKSLSSNNDLTSYLIARFAREAKFFLQEYTEDGEAVVKVVAPSELIPCGEMYITFDHKIELERKRKLPFKLTNEQVIKNQIFYPLVMEVVGDIQRQTSLSRRLGASYLTTRKLDYDVLDKFGGSKTKARVKPAPSLFSHMLPTLDNVSLERIIKLRLSEGEAFQIYRETVTKALNSIRSNDAKEERQVFDDLIRPELIRLDSTIRKARKILVKSASQDLVIALGSLAIGGITAVLPHEIRALSMLGPLVSGGGAIHYSKRFLQSIIKLNQESDAAINHRFYFLWKLGKKAS